MPKQQRFKTKYQGVYFINGEAANGGIEKVYYIRYLKNRKYVEEKAGRQFRDDMTAARAAIIRAKRINGEKTNNQIRSDQKEKELAADNRWTIGRLWDAYQKAKPYLKGWRTYESGYRKHVGPRFGHKTTDEVTVEEVNQFRFDLEKTLSPQSVKHQLVLLRRIVNYGVSSGYCLGFQFKINIPTVSNETTEDLTAEELERLFQTIAADKNVTAGRVMLLALFSGLRKMEMFRLKWSDIDFDQGFIQIRNPKSGQDERIPINDPTRELLMSIERGESGFVFPGRDKKNHIQSVIRGINRIRTEAKLPAGFRPLHGLRHVFASILASSGEVDMYTLQKLLTHKDSKMTQRYAHLRDEALKRAAASTSKIFNNMRNVKVTE